MQSGKTPPITLPSGVWLGDQHCRQVYLRPGPATDEVFAFDSPSHLPPAQRATALLANWFHSGENDLADPVELARALTAGDREALLLHLRREMLGNELDCLLRCPSAGCNEPMSLVIQVTDLLLPPYPNPQPIYQVELAHDGVKYRVGFRVPTGADLESAATAAHNDDDSAAELLVRSCLHDIDPAPGPERLDSMMSALTDVLSTAVAERDPQAELQLELSCPACGTSFSTLFDAAVYLFEELDQQADAIQREIEALAFHYHWAERDILSMSRGRRQKYLDLLGQRLTAETTS
jgi:hypothetical protein